MRSMKGGLAVDDPSGERWDLALELLDEGRDFVLLGHVQLARHHGWPGADNKVHVAVLTTDPSPSHAVAQREVDEARERVRELLDHDQRLRLIMETYGVVWEYAGDDGSATSLISSIGDDGSLLWDRS
jgi:hypothetical protein